jgi:drug/metabolite transporter (DMT)-like permease
MSAAQAVAVTIGLAALATFGDYFLKLASLDTRALHSKWFVAGCCVYVLGAFGWVFVLRHLKLATIGVVYSLSTVLLLTVLGAVVFDESLNRYEVAGIAFGVLSILLLARFSG